MSNLDKNFFEKYTAVCQTEVEPKKQVYADLEPSPTTESTAKVTHKYHYTLSRSNTDSCKKNKIISFSNISSIVLSVLAMIFIIGVMNFQDYRRNIYENWNTSIVYFILLALLGIFLAFSIYSLTKKQFKLPSYMSLVLLFATIVSSIEGSIFSEGWKNVASAHYVDEKLVFNDAIVDYYLSSETVEILNVLWISCVVLIFIVTLLPWFYHLPDTWHSSVKYREKCYKRVAKMHNYFEKGIISEEEYLKAKCDILKNIK